MKRNKQLETLRKYSDVFGVPGAISMPVIHLFLHHVTSNGEEWTCTRFKSIKFDFVRLRAGLDISTPWISKRDCYHFKGPFGGLQKWAEKSAKNWKAAIQMLQIYSTLVASDVTQQQEQKFVSAVTGENDSKFIDCYSEIARGVVTDFFKPSALPNPPALFLRGTSDTRREPHPSGKSFAEGTKSMDCAVSFITETSIGSTLRHRYPRIFRHVMEGIVLDDGHHAHYQNEWIPVEYQPRFPSVVGKIGLIQEPGYKLRAVANPGRVFQQALRPLGDSLYSSLKILPWDCTHNQSHPFVKIQDHLSRNSMAYCVDLSNATDRFPLAIQMAVLRTMFPYSDDVCLFEDLSKASWSSPWGPLAWKVGQPLGLYPSFAAFALTHGLILYALNNRSHNDMFFVLGDDVIILDEHLYDKYMLFLARCKLPYSETKTIKSAYVAEFGGKIITKDDVIQQSKWRRMDDNSFLDLAKNYGPRSTLLMRSRQKKIFDKVQVIPDFLGGCGFNPRGLPLEDRVFLYYDSLRDDFLHSYLMSYNGRCNSWNYTKFDLMISEEQNLMSTLPHRCEYEDSTFDQKAAHFALKLIKQVYGDHSPFMGSETSYAVSCNKQLAIQHSSWIQNHSSVFYAVDPENRDFQLDTQGVVQNTTLSILERKF